MKTVATILLLALVTVSFAHGFRPVRATAQNVALAGFDPVVIYAEGKARRGYKKFSMERDGVIWYFEDATNRKLFGMHPEMFVPEFGGYCAVGVAYGKIDEDAEPEAFVVHEGKVYFVHDQATLCAFREDPDAMIAQARKKWEAMNKAQEEASKSEDS
ncbi:MAG: YHS domain-containing (seleno)protein [Verrucomicrobiota bacterium]